VLRRGRGRGGRRRSGGGRRGLRRRRRTRWRRSLRRLRRLLGLVIGTQVPFRREHPAIYDPDRVLVFRRPAFAPRDPPILASPRRPTMIARVSEALSDLAALVARLRRECPWDREQTPETIKTYLLEECYEALEALDSKDPKALADELGDLLFQVFFLATLAAERGWFQIDDVARGVTRKMTERHPHVFGEQKAKDAPHVPPACTA